MKPYYEESGVTIYNADCREVLPFLSEPHVAIVTDQPFGTGWLRGGGAVGVFEPRFEKPAWDVFSLEWLDLCSPKFWAAFAPNSQAETMLRYATARVNWRKTNPRPNGPPIEPIFMWPIHLPECFEWEGYNGDTEFHPCQKPEPLMRWLLGFCNPSWCVIDPFMGSGTTLVAAKALGRKAIGIEINKDYCDIAIERLRQGALNFNPAESEQMEISA